MNTYLILAISVCALTAILADWNESRPKIFYVLKPLTTILIIFFAYLAPESTYRSWLIVGLFLSLIGDICMMFDQNDAPFLGGVVIFFFAHLAFITAILNDVSYYVPPLWAWLVVIYNLVFSAWLLPKAGHFKIPLLIYGSTILGMAMAAALNYQSNPNPFGTLIVIGAIFFIISDSVIGIRKFSRNIPMAQPIILSTYWVAIGSMSLAAYSA